MKNNETKKRIVHHKLEVGKALSLEPTIMLDVYDHEMDLQDRYEDEQLNPLFDTKVVNYKANNSMGRDDYREERVKRAVKKVWKNTMALYRYKCIMWDYWQERDLVWQCRTYE